MKSSEQFKGEKKRKNLLTGFHSSLAFSSYHISTKHVFFNSN